MTSKEAWDILERIFIGDAKVKKTKLSALRKQFENTHMKDQENVCDIMVD